MGVFDGVVVGLSVGAEVDTVGEVVGLHELSGDIGPTVGEFVLIVGVNEGLCVLNVGAREGLPVGGAFVGDFVGEVVDTVGDDDGARVASGAVGDSE